MNSKKLPRRKIQKTRKELELTVEQFSLLLNVSIRTIQRWEKNGIEKKSSSGAEDLYNLVLIMQDKVARQEFLKLKNTLSEASSSLQSLNNASLGVLNGLIPILGVVSNKIMGDYVGKNIISTLQNYMEKREKTT